ncbi:30S ribosomal protein S4 [Patescibacteria group bacterium]|nr:30S ribosomal protein S4 [Patescibacteria group bacterium]
MKIGPKYKIAKRLGAAIFEKTQTQKFALSAARTSGQKSQKRPGQMSDFKKQLIEKQKLRYTYGITEKQLGRYVKESLAKSRQPAALLTQRLESRLDNVVYRLGLVKTRRMARQVVSHGHIKVNGKRFTIPSHEVKVGDAIEIREGSKQSALFVTLGETYEATGVPAWVSFDAKKLTGEVKGVPQSEVTERLFDVEQVLEYYSR